MRPTRRDWSSASCRGPRLADAAEHVDVAVVAGMGDARNVINVLSSDVVIACPGGSGTVSEVALALKSKKRVILLSWALGDPPWESFLRCGPSPGPLRKPSPKPQRSCHE